MRSANFEQVLNKKQTQFFRGLTLHDNFHDIDVGQKCISAGANCLRQQANELCTFDVEGKCVRTGRNCINENDIKSTTQI